MPTSKETRVRVEGFLKLIARVRPGRRWCSSQRAWRCFSSSARSSTDSSSSRLQSATRVKLRPFRLSEVALIAFEYATSRELDSTRLRFYPAARVNRRKEGNHGHIG